MSGNLEMLAKVARRLGPLADEVVFVGGAVTGLLVTDSGAPEPRPTADVDAIVEANSRSSYYAFADRLRAAGFKEHRSEGAPLCRWEVDGVLVDLMPPDAEVLGFSNRWYAETARHAVSFVLPDGVSVRVATAPFFLATKLEAFAGRGRGDFAASHDLEDLIAVVDGRETLLDEVLSAPEDLRRYLSQEIGRLLASERFVVSVAGHLPSDDASQQRAPMVLSRLEKLVRSRKHETP